MNQYEITLTGDDMLAQLEQVCAIEPGVYGKRWNPDGSLAVMVRSERTSQELLTALNAPAVPNPVESASRRPVRRPSISPESSDEAEA